MADETDDEAILRHDSAPWIAGESLGGSRGVWLEGDDENPICKIGDRPDVAEVAALIAAAPDLLKALKDARDFIIEALNDLVKLPGFDAAEHAQVKEIDDVIARAEGGGS